MPFKRLTKIIAILVWLLTGGGLWAQEFPLRPGDLLDLRIYGRDDLSTQRRIDELGRFSVPLLGRIEAAGHTPPEIEVQIAKGLRDGGYLQDPVIAVDVMRRQDVFVDGDVAAPGAYEWRSGMTLRHVVALAGGMAGARPDELSTTLEAYQAQEELGNILTRIDGLRAREARLLTEIAFAQKLVLAEGDDLPEAPDQIDFPKDILGRPELAPLRQTQTELLEHQSSLNVSSIRSMRLELQALTRTRELLRQRMAVNQGTVDLLRGRLEELLKLSKAGLIRTQEVVEMQTALSSAESSQLELLTSLAANEQESQRQDLAIESVGMDSRRDAAAALEALRLELVTAQAQLPAIRRASAVARAYLAEPAELTEARQIAFQLISAATGETIPAQLDDPISPGDIVLVTRKDALSDDHAATTARP